MSTAVDAITRLVNRALSQQVRPLYLDLDEDLRLREWRGKPACFGLPELQAGMPLVDEIPLLATADPATADPQSWRFVELRPGHVSHVFLLRQHDGWAIALLDAREEHEAQQSRQQVAHELLLLRDEREQLLAELKQANRLKTEFIGRMSHEFRTPLASVIGYTDTLRELRPEDREVQYHLGAVSRGANHLLNLVENLLDQARIEVDELALNTEACDLYEMSDEVEQLLRPIAEQRQLSLAWWLDGDVPPRIWTDPTRLKQILINLVGNAIKFTESGGVSVEFNWQDDRLQAVVADTGPGISDEDAARIFEPFQQGSKGRNGKGAGLGLAISRSLVQALGGDIRSSSQLGEGTRFEFDIVARTVQGGRSSDASTLRDRVIVIADDDPDLLALIKLYLAAAGCKPHTASDANSAKAAAKRFTPDVMLLDINLGSDDGRALATDLRGSGYRGRIVSMSAANDARGSSTQQDPFDAQWSKPISRGRLLDDLAQLLR